MDRQTDGHYVGLWSLFLVVFVFVFVRARVFGVGGVKAATSRASQKHE